MMKASFHLLIKHAVESEMNVHRLWACWTNIRWVVTSLQMLCRKSSFSLICLVLTSIGVQTYAQGVTIKLVSKSLFKKTPHEFQKIQRRVIKPCLLSQGACSQPAFSRSCCIRSTSICELKFDRQVRSGANNQANVLQFAAFCDHGWGHVAMYPRCPKVLI